jgi:hypothetical protein
MVPRIEAIEMIVRRAMASFTEAKKDQSVFFLFDKTKTPDSDSAMPLIPHKGIYSRDYEILPCRYQDKMAQ